LLKFFPIHKCAGAAAEIFNAHLPRLAPNARVATAHQIIRREIQSYRRALVAAANDEVVAFQLHVARLAVLRDFKSQHTRTPCATHPRRVNPALGKLHPF
jgi:hypothetical protein